MPFKQSSFKSVHDWNKPLNETFVVQVFSLPTERAYWIMQERNFSNVRFVIQFFFKKEIRIRLLKQFMQERRFSNVRFVIFFKKEMCVGIFKQFMKERSHFKWNMRDTCFPLRGVLIRLTQSVHKGTMSFKCNHCYVGFFRRGNLNTKLP